MYKYALLFFGVAAWVPGAPAVSVGGFLSPGLAVGAAAAAAPPSLFSFYGEVAPADFFRFRPGFGVGFADRIYRTEYRRVIRGAPINTIRAHYVAAGVDYLFYDDPGFNLRGGGGAVWVWERAALQGYYNEYVWRDSAGGYFFELGVGFSLTKKLSFEASPRFSYLFDNPVYNFDSLDPSLVFLTDAHSQFVEVLWGFRYSF